MVIICLPSASSFLPAPLRGNSNSSLAVSVTVFDTAANKHARITTDYVVRSIFGNVLSAVASSAGAQKRRGNSLDTAHRLNRSSINNYRPAAVLLRARSLKCLTDDTRVLTLRRLDFGCHVGGKGVVFTISQVFLERWEEERKRHVRHRRTIKSV